MTNLINVEDAREVMVGRTYLVNTVRTLTKSIYRGEPIPILGQMHEDREVIRFAHDHIHVDWRFVTQAMYEYADTELRKEIGVSVRSFWNLLSVPLSVGHSIQSGPAIKRVPLECKRSFELWSDRPEWMARLEMAFIGRRACKDICPHRGISLVGAPEDPDIPGSRVCPGHGLCFDKETGVLRPRAMQREAVARMINHASDKVNEEAWSHQ